MQLFVWWGAPNPPGYGPAEPLKESEMNACKIVPYNIIKLMLLHDCGMITIVYKFAIGRYYSPIVYNYNACNIS